MALSVRALGEGFAGEITTLDLSRDMDPENRGDIFTQDFGLQSDRDSRAVAQRGGFSQFRRALRAGRAAYGGDVPSPGPRGHYSTFQSRGNGASQGNSRCRSHWHSDYLQSCSGG